MKHALEAQYVFLVAPVGLIMPHSQGLVMFNEDGGGDGEQEKSFYSMPEFEEWQKENPDTWHTWKIKWVFSLEKKEGLISIKFYSQSFL